MPSVVITGAAGGIGAATCERLLRSGWSVVAVDRDVTALQELEARLDVRAVAGDVREESTMLEARRAAEQLGELTGWVNNAALLRSGPLHEATADQIAEQLAVNLHSVVLGAREAISSFLESGAAGSIVNVTSIHARNPFPGHPLYATAKGGVEALTRQLCVEYGDRGIRVNAVAPGAVDTTMTTGDGDPEAALKSAAALSPMGRVSSPGEIAAAIAFLLSPESPGINGHVLAVDNGMSAQGRSL
jgi:NAD(P)-dependent dehydrogenase (short-subunit alcohol dehydrogenase family)